MGTHRTTNESRERTTGRPNTRSFRSPRGNQTNPTRLDARTRDDIPKKNTHFCIHDDGFGRRDGRDRDAERCVGERGGDKSDARCGREVFRRRRVSVADLAIGVMKKMAQKTHECVVNAALVPACLEALDPKEKWQTQVAAAEALATACKTSSNIIASNLTTILPVVASMVNDAKQQVADATRKCLEDLCRTIDNRDVEPFIPAMVEATIDHEKSDECVQKLASTTFVQTVTAAPLALISPILLLGFRSRATATKRMSAVIVNNMSKLVEDPEDAAPFLPNLLPAVTKASEQVSDPEARAVCGKACEQLQSIEAKLNDASFKSKRAVFDDVKKQTDAKLGAHFDVNDKIVSDFYATVACALVNAKAQDYDFEEALGKSFPVDDIRALHATLEQMYGDVEDEEDDDDTADVLADCQFTLAYR